MKTPNRLPVARSVGRWLKPYEKLRPDDLMTSRVNVALEHNRGIKRITGLTNHGLVTVAKLTNEPLGCVCNHFAFTSMFYLRPCAR